MKKSLSVLFAVSLIATLYAGKPNGINKPQKKTTPSLTAKQVQTAKNAIIIIKGKDGCGTGFVADFKGKKVIITNTHVIKNNKNFKFYTRSGREVKIKNLFFAKDRDISMLETEDKFITPLQICTKVGELKTSTEVVVYGNSLGESVITEVKGKLQGTGPTEIESDAKFVEGNSGSPIIDTSNGLVIGVATRATCRYSWTTHNTKFQVRRFGTRIDNITWNNLQEYNRKKYAYDLYLLRKIRSSVVTAALFLKLLNSYYAAAPDEFDKNVRKRILHLHRKLGKEFLEVPELKFVYRQWNRSYQTNLERLKANGRSRNYGLKQKSFKNSAFNNFRPVPTDLTMLLDFHRIYYCLKYTVPKIISAGRKQHKKKSFHYEFFKREGEQLLDVEKELLKKYNSMMKNLSSIYKKAKR
jgi:hypothetical protein